jgi:hydrogenase-4 component B
MEITAGSFSRSLITIFRGILRSTKQTDTEYHDEHMRYFIKSQEVKTAIGDPYRKTFYGPINALLAMVASRARRIQGGSINIYLLYIFITLMALLAWASRSSS